MGKMVLLLLALLFSISTFADTYYVAVTGDDANNGTSVESPLKTLSKAVSLSQPGDIIYVRGGVHEYNSTINISKSGTSADTCFILAFPNERPVLNFSAEPFGKRGISLSGSYWYIKGLDVCYAGDNGLNISGGGNNVLEFCSFYENKDSGVQLGNGAHDNTFINCDSYYNADPTDYGDADGFAPKLDVGSNNKFVGCRAWGNCDDGWDGYMRGATNVTTILENCWTWGNGYLKDGTDPGAQANGNGFKMGGGDGGNSQNLTHHFYLSNCLAFYNKAKGFDQNNNAGSMELLNCSGYGNLTANFRIKRDLAEGETLTVKNCISYIGNVELGNFAIQETNSWFPQFIVSTDDFMTIDSSGVSSPRKADGSLPDLPFLRLASGSDLIDSGTDVGLPFFGIAPDLGAFEFNPATKTKPDLISETRVWLNGENLIVNFREGANSLNTIKLYSVNGQLLLQKQITFGENNISCPGLKPGIYLAELISGSNRTVHKLMR